MKYATLQGSSSLRLKGVNAKTGYYVNLPFSKLDKALRKLALKKRMRKTNLGCDALVAIEISRFYTLYFSIRKVKITF